MYFEPLAHIFENAQQLSVTILVIPLALTIMLYNLSKTPSNIALSNTYYSFDVNKFAIVLSAGI